MYWDQTNEVYQETYWSAWWPEAAETHKHAEETNECQTETSLPETYAYSSEDQETNDYRSEASVQAMAKAGKATNASAITITTSNKTNQELLKEIVDIIDKLEDRIQKLQSNAFQLANYYFVFQGVIFTAISNGSTSLKCRDVWIPLLLSLIAALLNFSTLFMTGVKYKKWLVEQERNWNKRQTLFQRMNDPAGKVNPGNGRRRSFFRDPSLHRRRCFFLYASMALFIFFAFVTILGCYRMLCMETHSQKQL